MSQLDIIVNIFLGYGQICQDSPRNPQRISNGIGEESQFIAMDSAAKRQKNSENKNTPKRR